MKYKITSGILAIAAVLWLAFGVAQAEGFPIWFPDTVTVPNGGSGASITAGVLVDSSWAIYVPQGTSTIKNLNIPGVLAIGRTATTTIRGDNATSTFSNGITLTSGCFATASGCISAGAGGTPGGSDTQVQFNDSSAFGGDAGLVFNKTTNILTISGGIISQASSTIGGLLVLAGGINSSSTVASTFAGNIDIANNSGLRGYDTSGTPVTMITANDANDAHLMANVGNGNALDSITIGFNSDVPIAFGGSCCGGSLPTSFSFETSGGVTFTSTGIDFTNDPISNLTISDTSVILSGASTEFTATGNFSINTDDLFINKATGLVGIGTTSPGTLFSVGGDGTGINLVDNGTSTFSNGIVLASGCIYKKSTGACISEVPSNITGILQETAGSISNVTVGSSLDYTGTTLSVGTVAIVDGGTNATSQTTNGIAYYNGSAITTGTALTFDGTSFAFTGTATSTFNGGVKFNNGINTGFISNSGRFEFGNGTATSTLQYDKDAGGQLTMATTSSAVLLASAQKLLWGATMASTSVDTSSGFNRAGKLIPIPTKMFAVNANTMYCSVWGGTNVAIRLRDSSANVTNTITCTSSSTSTPFSINSNGNFTAAEGTSLEIVSVSGTSDYLWFSIYGTTTPN